MTPRRVPPEWIREADRLARVAERRAQDAERMLRDANTKLREALWWCPLEWRRVIAEYEAQGVPLEYLRLAGRVQFLGATRAGRPHRIDPDAPVSALPPRTTDLVERLREDHGDEAAVALLRNRGYRLDGDGQLAALPGVHRRPPLLWRDAARELATYLRPRYDRVAAWDQDAKVPGRLVKHIHTLLLPYFPDLREARVRGALEDLSRPSP